MDLSVKAKELSVAANAAEKAVEDDPRSKARNVKTAQQVKKELN